MKIQHALCGLFLILCLTTVARAVTIGDVCRVKGQETNTLQGMGLVVGLSGTGDGDAPTTRALAMVMQHLGNPIGGGGAGGQKLDELKNVTNVALVFVSATVPARGVHEGGRINCQVNAVSAKSLRGGHLLPTTLSSPRPGDKAVYAVAQGALSLENKEILTTAKVQFGARMVRTVSNAFFEKGAVTLVVDDKHASFTLAHEIEYAINADQEFKGQELAQAIDAKTVRVKIPSIYKNSPVLFMAALTDISLDKVPREKRIVINEAAGVIAIGDRVEILPVAIAHKNLTIEVGSGRVNEFSPLNPTADTSTEPLQSLIKALNALRVSTPDMIEIIKTLDREGAIYGKVILQ